MIIIFSNYDDIANPAYGGGGARAIHEVTKRLAKESDVTVITGTYPGAVDMVIDGVRYERIGTYAFGPKLGQLIYSLLLPFVAWRKSFDVWYESLTPPFSCSFLPIFARGPVVALVHMLSGEDMRRKYRLPFHLVERAGLRLYRRFVVLSEVLASQVRRSNPGADIAVIPNGVDMPQEPAHPETGKHVLFIGRTEVDQKGLDLLVSAWSSVASRVSLQLLIAGSGQVAETQRLKEIVEDSGCSDSIRLVGHVTGAEKDSLFRDAALVAIPSRFETFSMVALEAFSYGLPVVSFDIPNMRWFPDEVAIRIDPFDTVSFGKTIASLLDDPDRRRRMGAAARESMCSYDWDDIAERYMRHAELVTRKL
ncbi:MAG: glycosyltransferase family 4 protein [Candidatus Moranbacteria bacterium]|nr:glycosyltransferase family 4 protein [Candidatus Moranbacteria bacterium]